MQVGWYSFVWCWSLQLDNIYYHPQSSCGKVMLLHMSVILFTGEIPLWKADTPIPGQAPPPLGWHPHWQADIPLADRAPSGRQTPARQTPPAGRHPPWADTPPGRQTLSPAGMVRIPVECILVGKKIILGIVCFYRYINLNIFFTELHLIFI